MTNHLAATGRITDYPLEVELVLLCNSVSFLYSVYQLGDIGVFIPGIRSSEGQVPTASLVFLQNTLQVFIQTVLSSYRLLEGNSSVPVFQVIEVNVFTMEYLTELCKELVVVITFQFCLYSQTSQHLH